MDPLSQIREAVLRAPTFLLTSHARPDGDSIGSQVAFAAALRSLGKQVRIVNRDAPPAPFLALPGVHAIEVAASAPGDHVDALVVMECSDLSRPGVAGLEGRFTINIDHHPGNAMYGAINWFDESAAACGEMVADAIDALGVPWSPEIATHLYLAVLTDTGSFRFGNLSARTFTLCRRAVEAGVDAAALARRVYDSNSVGKLKLIGALLDGMELVAGARAAILTLDDSLMAATGAEAHDTDGLINMPLMAAAIEAVALIRQEGDLVRVSLRSKGPVDVRAIAATFGGGGHVNASGFTSTEPFTTVRDRIEDLLNQGIRDKESRESGNKGSRNKESRESRESKASTESGSTP